jgi:hypothetical protein
MTREADLTLLRSFHPELTDRAQPENALRHLSNGSHLHLVLAEFWLVIYKVTVSTKEYMLWIYLQAGFSLCLSQRLLP